MFSASLSLFWRLTSLKAARNAASSANGSRSRKRLRAVIHFCSSQCGDPFLFLQGLANQGGQAGVGLHQPAPRGHTVSLVVEFFWPQLGELRNQGIRHAITV